ncbi:MAG: anhydro-N-acetylmuramic acid kinase [Bacteroidia bacterium]|nr:anhydro-N-acetylmuramic acid kinase [Bacteroidia bacterium]
MKPSSPGSWRVLSLMAGSSADGITCALVLYRRKEGSQPSWEFSLIEGTSIPYPSTLRHILLRLSELSAYELLKLSIAYTDWTAEALRSHFSARVYDLIVWHPHNLFHEPSQGLSWNLGDSERLRVKAGKPVVSHFRIRDITSGGVGAPLIPNADSLLFSQYETLINLGGIANLTHLPTHTAYDITPCNQLLNALASQADPELSYDPEGELARKGRFVPELAQVFERHPFFATQPPKALNNQTVFRDFVLPFLRHPAAPEDKLYTATVLIAEKISEALQQLSARYFTSTGGGTHNRFLIELLTEKAQRYRCSYLPAPTALVEYREAIGFGLLGLLRYLGEDNTHHLWTGAARSHSSGLLSL